jgi:hypothetical protein
MRYRAVRISHVVIFFRIPYKRQGFVIGIVLACPLNAQETQPDTAEAYFVGGIHAKPLVEGDCEDIS